MRMGFVWMCFVCAVVPVRSLEISVCCPSGHSFDPDRFRCAEDVDESNNDTVNIYGFNLRASNESQIPQCEKPLLIKVRYEVHVSPRSCLVWIFNELFAISCPSETNVGLYHQVSVIRKCCPIDEIYDPLEKMCIPSGLLFDMYRKSFRSPVVFNHPVLQCSPDDVIVEYYANYRDIKIVENRVVISGSNKIEFDADSYCLDMAHTNGSDIININSIPSNKLADGTPLFAKSTSRMAAETTLDDFAILIRTCSPAAICTKIPCVRRCCGNHMQLVREDNQPKCVHDETDLKVVFHNFEARNGKFEAVVPKVYGLYQGLSCRKYLLDPEAEDFDLHYISYLDGSLFFPSTYSTFDNMNYCIEKLGPEVGTFLCFEDVEKDTVKFSLYSVGILVSTLFFALTLLVYLSIPKLRNLPGKILICLVSCLLVAYLSISVGMLRPPSDSVCYGFAFFIYFSLMAAFTWINVMCFDIWLTFGSSQHSHGMGRAQTKRFIYYSIYGWGLPTVLTIVTVLLTRYPILDSKFRPTFGNGKCWFQYAHNWSHLIFFLTPVGILFLSNFVLFVLTLRYCNEVKREIRRMQSSNMQKPMLRRRFNVDKAQFLMNTKLLVVMGILWILEILSIVFFDRKQMFFWLLSDSFNVLQGVYVFLIFVCKRRVWYAIMAKFGIKANNSPRHGATTLATNSVHGGGNMIRMASTMGTSTSLLNVNDTNRLSPSHK